MKRGIAFALLGALAFAGGCASPARIVSQNPDGSGIVAVPDNSNTFPFYYKDKAMALVKEKAGPDFTLGPATEVATQQPQNPNVPGDKPKSATECQYIFRRGPMPVGSGLTSTGVTPGVTMTGINSAGGATQLPPGVLPSVLPAGGTQPVSGSQRGSGNW